jgi:hypothetical protein
VQAGAHGLRHQRVITRVKLHLVDALAEAAVGFQLRRVHVGQPRMRLHLAAAHHSAQRMQRRRVQRRGVELQGRLQGPVGGKQVHVHQRLGLVEHLVRGGHGALRQFRSA